VSHTEGSDRATHVAVEEDRMPRGALAMVSWSLCSAMFYLFLGATLALNFGTRNAIVGAVLGVASFSVLGPVFVRYAIRTGRSCYLLSQELFGSAGASVTTLIIFATFIYYAVFESAVLAAAVSKVVPRVDYATACILIVLYSVPLVAGSVQRWLDKINGVLLPIYLGGLALTVIMAINEYGYSSAWLRLGPGPSASNPMGWWNCFVAYFALQGLLMCTLDLARFGRKEDINYHSSISFGLALYLVAFLANTLVGVFLAGTVGQSHVTETVVMDACLAALGATMGLIFVWVTQTRINTANYFLAATNMQAFFAQTSRVRLPRALWAMIVGLVVLLLLRSTSVLRYILIAVNYQGVILSAWVGVAIAHITIEKRETRSDERAEAIPLFETRGLTAWTTGAAVGATLALMQGVAATLDIPVAMLLALVVYRWFPLLRTSPPSTAVGR